MFSDSLHCKKRKNEDIHNTQPNSIELTFGQEPDFLVLENQKRKHIKTIQEECLPAASSEQNQSSDHSAMQTVEEVPEVNRFSYSRMIEMKFASQQDTYRARIVCKVKTINLI